MTYPTDPTATKEMYEDKALNDYLGGKLHPRFPPYETATPPTWPMNATEHVNDIGHGIKLVQRVMQPRYRICDPRNVNNYIEFGFNDDGIFVVECAEGFSIENMDTMAKAFIGSVMARMNKVVR